MALDPDLKADFDQTIHVAKPTGVAGVGGLAYGAPVEMLAKFEPKQSIVEQSDGTRRVTTHWLATDGENQAALGTFVLIEDHDRIWPPGADETKSAEARLPAKVDEAIDEDGNFEHWEVRL
jgi:hypothetical protein